MTPSPIQEARPLAAAWRVRRAAVRWLIGGVLCGQLWLPNDHLNYYRSLFRVEIVDDFFPAPLQDPWVPTTACILMLLSCCYTMLRPTRLASACCAAVLLLGSGAHLFHLRMFFGQEFAIRFWVALWLSWLVTRTDESQQTLATAASLALIVCSLIFLGGAVGKWTSAYWSGEVLGDLVFQAPTPGFSWLRAQLTAEQLSTAALWHSRAAVVGETLMAGMALLSPRTGLPLFLAFLSAMYLASPWTVLEALGGIFGLCLAGLCLVRAARSAAS